MPTRRSGQPALCLAALAAGAGLAVAVASAGADEPTTASITAKDPYSFDNGSGGSSARINRAARRALHRDHRLGVTVRIAVTPAAGTAFKKTLKVALREKS